jgi:hypothetical protein
MDKTFESPKDFYTELKKSKEIFSMFPNYTAAFESTIGGCNCTKKVREKNLDNAYLNLDRSFTDEKLQAMQQFFSVKKFIFKNQGEIFMTIE